MDKITVLDEDTLKEVVVPAPRNNQPARLQRQRPASTQTTPEAQTSAWCKNLLLQAGYNIDSPACDLEASLFWAVDNRNVLAVKLLLGRRVSVHARGASRSTALHHAAKSWNTEIVRMLLTHGAKADAIDDEHRNPLHVAMRPNKVLHTPSELPELDSVPVQGQNGTPNPGLLDPTKDLLSIARLLFEHKAPADTKDLDGRTPLWYAIDNGYEALIRLLIVDFGASTSDPSLLSLSAVKGRLLAARLLIAHDANLEFQNSNGETALYLAAANNHKPVVEMLFARKAGGKATVSPPGTQSMQVTVLHKAFYEGKEAAFRLLLEAGADSLLGSVQPTLFDPLLHVFDHVSKLPSRDATLRYLSTRHLRIIKMLIRRKQRYNQHARKLLQRAIRYNFAPDAINLLRAGVSPIARLKELQDNPTTLIQQIQGGSSIPRQRTHPGGTLLHQAAWIGNPAVVQALLLHGAGVNDQNDSNETPLFAAINNQGQSIISILLSHGAEINHPNDEGQTPLHMSVKNGDVKSARLLLQHRPALDSLNRLGFSPLHLAVLNGAIAMVELLLEHGFDPETTAQDGRSSIDLSKSLKNSEMTRLLLTKAKAEKRPFWKRKSKLNPKQQPPQVRRAGMPPELATSGAVHEVHGDSNILEVQGEDSRFELSAERG